MGPEAVFVTHPEAMGVIFADSSVVPPAEALTLNTIEEFGTAPSPDNLTPT